MPVEWEAIIPASKRVTIEVRPGTVPPERRVAARLLDILPKTWALNLRQLPPNHVTPPGWETGHGMSSVAFDGYAGPYKEHRVGVRLWIGDRKLRWTGKWSGRGQRAAIYLGKCVDGYVYADLPSVVEAKAAGWPGEASGDPPFAARSTRRCKLSPTTAILRVRQERAPKWPARRTVTAVRSVGRLRGPARKGPVLGVRIPAAPLLTVLPFC